MVRDLPAVVREVAAGEKARLYARREFEVFFERALLRGCQAAEADGDERVGQESVGLDRALADFAKAVRVLVHARERGVNLFEQEAQLRVVVVSDEVLKPVSAFEQLISKRGVNNGSHHCLP